MYPISENALYIVMYCEHRMYPIQLSYPSSHTMFIIMSITQSLNTLY
jgi:hypothetical protein